MNLYECTICKKGISKTNKVKHEKTKKHQRNLLFQKGGDSLNPYEGDGRSPTLGGDLQSSKVVSALLKPFTTEKYPGERHLFSHSYTGPGTRLDVRLDENDKPKPGEEPINRIDEAALKHDIAYRSNDLRDRHKADVDLIHDLNEIKNPTLKEKLERVIVKNVMKAKILMGGGQSSIALGGGQSPIVLGGGKNITTKEEILANELHKEYRKPSKFLKIQVFKKDDIWGADLVEMPNMKNNNDFKYILTVIDLYTKFAWAIPLKTKTSHSIKSAFEFLFETTPDRIPNKLYTDNGKEFYNKIFQDFLQENEIKIYSTFNQPDERSQGPSHNPVIERFNRTLKNLMFKKFTENGNRIWINILPEILNFYNNKIHRTIKTTPQEASDNPKLIQEIVNKNNNENNEINEKQKFNVGDRVRIYKWKNKFEKGYTYRWSKEIFIIKKVYNTKPITYKIHDLNDEEILGRFYQNELQKTWF